MNTARRPLTGPRLAILLAVGLAATGDNARGQEQIRDFTRPFVALDTGGHNAPVRSIVITPDGASLLSAGMDKVVHAWNLEGGRGELSRTIRPAIWRGYAGIIYATALSPVAEPDGSRLLAIAGYGVWSTRGNISLFRYPGDANLANGQLVAQLPSHVRSDPNSRGHSDTVMALAFSPDGRSLASCGVDGRVLLWDVAGRKLALNLSGEGKAVNSLAFRPDGRRLAAGGADGILRLWDLERRIQLPPAASAYAASATDPDGPTILALGFTRPDGGSILVGRENGILERFDGDALRPAGKIQQNGEVLGPIEALALSPDGRTLAVSVVKQGAGDVKLAAVRPRVDCEIQLRAMPAGTLQPTRFSANNLVYALAFTPDGKKLAFAGGDEQAIAVHDVSVPARPSMMLRGQGSSVWRVGFGKDSRSVGFSHAQEHEGPNVEYLGFDLRTQALKAVLPNELDRAQTTFGEWRVQPQSPLALTVLGPGGKSFPITLHPSRNRRWWAYSFIPPSPSHPKACVAVACETGVAIHRLEDGERTRFFAGHTAAVYDLAPSADGMWLATGSADQTVRIWSLAGCDTRPPLGATFKLGPDGKYRAEDVVKRGFAEGMGLKVGDALDVLAVGGAKREKIEKLEELDSLPPDVGIEFRVIRGQEAIEIGTTRRDSPRISLFVGEDREWVVWTPEGYYETSPAGDRKYLGWHRNGPTINAPTDRFPADKFEKELRKPALLTALINTGDPAQALAAIANPVADPAALVQAQAPPVVTLDAQAGPMPADHMIQAPPGGLTVRAQVAAEGRSPIASVQVLVDGRPVAPPTTFNPPQDKADERIAVPLHPGRQKVVVVAKNEAGRERSEAIEVVAPIEVTRKPKLHVLTIGASGPFRDAKYPTIPFAAEDARDLRGFFAAPGRKVRFPEVADLAPIVGPEAKQGTLRERFKALVEEVKDPNDALIVVLESHVLTGAKDRFVIATDTGPEPNTAQTPTAEEIADSLAKVAERGCKVMLLLDTSHEKAPEECRAGLSEFVRGLSRRNVITFVAANHGVSRRVVPMGHGAFAQAILESFDARARSRPLLDKTKPMTLDDFQDAVVSRVKELTGRKQFAACYIPETLSPRVPIFEPNRPQSLVEAK